MEVTGPRFQCIAADRRASGTRSAAPACQLGNRRHEHEHRRLLQTKRCLSVGRADSLLLAFCGILSYGLLGCWDAGLRASSAPHGQVHRADLQCSRKRYRLRPRSPLASSPSSSVPGVSILRPLKGLDTNLYENLESSFTQDYPNFEILLSVDSEADQALPVVRELLGRYPRVNARIVISTLSGVGDSTYPYSSQIRQ